MIGFPQDWEAADTRAFARWFEATLSRAERESGKLRDHRLWCARRVLTDCERNLGPACELLFSDYRVRLEGMQGFHARSSPL